MKTVDQIARLRMEHITKTYPGVRAVQDVTLEVFPGEILALAGENGAGKTTLMNVLTGVVQADEGRIYLDGKEVRVDSPRRAQELGISMIHQELALIPQLTVGQNIYLGREPRSRLPAVIDWPRLYRDAQQALDRMNLSITVKAQIADLSNAERQLVEIAKALSFQARLIVFDEPTSSLTERETHVLFELMRSLRREGVSLIYISHRMEEIFELSDRVAVMRDGQLVGVEKTAALSTLKVVQMMVGRELTEFFPKQASQPGEVVLRAERLRSGRLLRDASLELRRGEIVGLAGLVGAGRTDLAEALFGARPLDAGQIWVNGQPEQIRSPRDAIRLGIALVPEDRKIDGLFLGQSVRSNAGVSLLGRFSRLGFINFRKIAEQVSRLVEQLKIRTPSLTQRVRNLSGGNQQKVVISRWLALNPKILILDEPTRGVDVAAKAEIHGLISDLASQGMAILMISSELPEVLGVSDRVLVMREGRVVAEFPRAEATQDRIMQAATGQAPPPALRTVEVFP
ncbi:MAG TPA: sugar ABC transporter ATP-binding protein [Anaerolineaceae bacterium]|nr:sugar ABC transporter ATP-binding protein [Anaerolineaceae bacterium]